jgi:hypothetical protein
MILDARDTGRVGEAGVPAHALDAHPRSAPPPSTALV